jgi:hypothetical protein
VSVWLSVGPVDLVSCFPGFVSLLRPFERASCQFLVIQECMIVKWSLSEGVDQKGKGC